MLPALKAKQYPISVITGVNQDALQVIPDHVHCNADVHSSIDSFQFTKLTEKTLLNEHSIGLKHIDKIGGLVERLID